MCGLWGRLRGVFTALLLPADRLSDFDELLYREEQNEVFEPRIDRCADCGQVADIFDESRLCELCGDKRYHPASGHLIWGTTDVPSPGQAVPPASLPGDGAHKK